MINQKDFAVASQSLTGSASFIVNEAVKRNIKLRVMSGIGIILHCQEQKGLLKFFERKPSDIDFVALTKQESDVEKIFTDLGYQEKGGHGITMEVWTNRRIYEHPILPHVDVFFDGLDFCHRLDFRKRLMVDTPTISLADLLLGKLQIVEINEKDLQDILMVNMTHGLSDKDDQEGINSAYIAKILSQDWGFYFTVVTNLEKAKKLAALYSQKAPVVKKFDRAHRQIDRLIKIIEAAPKSFKWKARSLIGEKVKWYRDPGEECRDIG